MIGAKGESTLHAAIRFIRLAHINMGPAFQNSADESYNSNQDNSWSPLVHPTLVFISNNKSLVQVLLLVDMVTLIYW